MKKETTDPTVSCTRCERDDLEVRKVLSRNIFTGKISEIGPFDKKCAYIEKNGELPAFNTVPRTTNELLYRIFINEEIPLLQEETDVIGNRIKAFLLLFIPTFIITIVIGVFSFFNLDFALTYLWFCQILTISIYAYHLRDRDYFLGIDAERDGITSIIGLSLFGFLPFMMLNNIFSHLSFFDFSRKKQIKRNSKYLGKRNRTKLFLQDDSGRLVLYFHIILVLQGLYLILLLILFFELFASFMIFIVLALVAGIPFVALFILGYLLYYIFHPIQLLKTIKYWITFPVVYLKKTFNKRPSIGSNNFENFENFWEQKIPKQDRTPVYYKIQLSLVSVCTVILVVPIVFYNFIVNSIVNGHVYVQLIVDVVSSPYNDITFVDTSLVILVFHYMTLILVISMFYGYVMRIVHQILFSFRAPDDVYHLAMSDFSPYEKKKINEDIKGLTKIETEEYIADEVIGIPMNMLNCPICKNRVDIGLRCDNCYTIYHEDHLTVHLENSEIDSCPVCGISIAIKTN